VRTVRADNCCWQTSCLGAKYKALLVQQTSIVVQQRKIHMRSSPVRQTSNAAQQTSIELQQESTPTRPPCWPNRDQPCLVLQRSTVPGPAEINRAWSNRDQTCMVQQRSIVPGPTEINCAWSNRDQPCMVQQRSTVHAQLKPDQSSPFPSLGSGVSHQSISQPYGRVQGSKNQDGSLSSVLAPGGGSNQMPCCFLQVQQKTQALMDPALALRHTPRDSSFADLQPQHHMVAVLEEDCHNNTPGEIVYLPPPHMALNGQGSNAHLMVLQRTPCRHCNAHLVGTATHTL